MPTTETLPSRFDSAAVVHKALACMCRSEVPRISIPPPSRPERAEFRVAGSCGHRAPGASGSCRQQCRRRLGRAFGPKLKGCFCGNLSRHLSSRRRLWSSLSPRGLETLVTGLGFVRSYPEMHNASGQWPHPWLPGSRGPILVQAILAQGSPQLSWLQDCIRAHSCAICAQVCLRSVK